MHDVLSANQRSRCLPLGGKIKKKASERQNKLKQVNNDGGGGGDDDHDDGDVRSID